MQLSTMPHVGRQGGSSIRAEVAVGHFGSSPHLHLPSLHPACWAPARSRRAAKVQQGRLGTPRSAPALALTKVTKVVSSPAGD